MQHSGAAKLYVACQERKKEKKRKERKSPAGRLTRRHVSRWPLLTACHRDLLGAQGRWPPEPPAAAAAAAVRSVALIALLKSYAEIELSWMALSMLMQADV
jgi:hypothetical protein